MLRMNREKNSSQTAVKKLCANYNSGYICSGIIIDSKLKQRVDGNLANKVCQIKRGRDCKYYDKCVKPFATID